MREFKMARCTSRSAVPSALPADVNLPHQLRATPISCKLKLMDSNKKHMTRAIELSRIHMQKGEGGPFGAVIVKDGKIVGEGWNRVTSTNDPTAHAEVVAIRRACENLKTFDLKGAILFTSCEPCPMCLSAAYWARVDKIHFACTRQDAARHNFDDEFIYHEIPKEHADRKLPITQLSRDEAYQVFLEWDKKTDKIPY